MGSGCGLDGAGRKLHHRHKVTPYDGETLSGVVKADVFAGAVDCGEWEDGGPPYRDVVVGADRVMGAIEKLNGMPEAEARITLGKCCGASRWVEGTVRLRPFKDMPGLLAAADEVWAKMGESADWLGVGVWASSEDWGCGGAAEEVCVDGDVGERGAGGGECGG